MNLPTTGLQFTQNSAGAWGVDDMPGVPAITTQDSGPVFDWCEALNLPKDRGKLEAMATPTGLSDRRLRFVIADESVTTLTGAPRFQPKRYLFDPHGQVLALAHIGFAIGILDRVWLAEPGDLEPGTVEGAAILGAATLYRSPLAAAAWVGIQRGIFGSVCGVIKTLTLTQRNGAVWQKDLLLEVALIDRAACQNARILKTWEE